MDDFDRFKNTIQEFYDSGVMEESYFDIARDFYRYSKSEIILNSTFINNDTKTLYAKGHTMEIVGTESTHSKCSVCGTTTSHSYTKTTITEPTCTEYSQTNNVCSCGYSYTGSIFPLSHNLDGNECLRCGEILEPGLYDNYGVMLCTWEESGIDDTCSNAKTIINNTYSTATKVVIPNSITTIGCAAFQNCTSLTDVTIPDSVTSIDNCAFQNCSNLKNVVILEGVTSITWRTFDGCTSLSDITIPDSATTMQTEAFRNCTNLTSVTYKNTTYTSKTELITALTNNGVTSNGTIFELSVFGSTGLTD